MATAGRSPWSTGRRARPVRRVRSRGPRRHAGLAGRAGDGSGPARLDGLPLFLVNGQPIHGSPLGAAKMNFRADRIKIQKIRETWWVTEDNRPLIEAGTREDAELLVQVIKVYDLALVCTFGRPEAGGLRLLTMGR